MKSVVRGSIALVCAAWICPSLAALNIFACEPEWGALARELGGDNVSVYTATTALQDPHRIEAKPSLLARARNADLAVCTGADLETGWLPIVLRESGNPRIQPGRPGYFEAAAHVSMLETPARLDRSQGDVHAAGNPHIQLDPRNIAKVADALARRLTELDSANAADYQSRHSDFKARWSAASVRWDQLAAPLKGIPVVVQHKAFPYLQNWLGLIEVAALEPKPGMEPTTAHLTSVLTELKRTPAKMVIRAAYQSDRPSEWIRDRARLPAVVLPFTVGGSPGAQDLTGLFDDTLQRLLTAIQ